MAQTSVPLQSTPLTSRHESLGAKMAPFAGWNMPIQYEGILAETLHTRQAASCFDTCHMGEFLVRGDGKRSGLDLLVSGRIDDMRPGTCRYTSLLNEKGGVIDDLIVLRKAAEEWMLVVNAATVGKDKEHLRRHLGKNSDFKDISQGYGKIDLQGPLSRGILAALAPQACALAYYTFAETDILGEKNIVSRTGYTGELGFEIYASPEKIVEVWETILRDPRVKPAGLGARDILRLEMGYSLYGQDIDETTTPLNAGLEKFVDFNKGFIGKEALQRQRTAETLKTRIFLKTLSRRAPRHGYRICDQDRKIGDVTSGTFSPHTSCGIGMGFIAGKKLDPGVKITLSEPPVRIDAVVTDRPFVKDTSLKT